MKRICLILTLEDKNVAKARKILENANKAGIHKFAVIGELTDSEKSVLFSDLGEIDVSWHAARLCAQKLAKFKGIANKTRDFPYLFSVSSSVSLDSAAMSRLMAFLDKSPILRGVSPQLFAPDFQYAVNLGCVADLRGNLRFLYHGLNPDDPALAKTRLFQTADGKALLFRRSAFLQKNSLNPSLEELAFVEANREKDAFATLAEARATIDDQFYYFNLCGLWNSLKDRGKLPDDFFTPDYPVHCAGDGFAYGVSTWLNDGPVMSPGREFEAPLVQFVNDPNPFALLKWLAEATNLRETINLIRRTPWVTPREFQYYLAKAQILLVRGANIPDFATKIRDWQKRAMSFHYGRLRKGMKLLADAGFYDSSLDTTPTVYDAWIELAENFAEITPGADTPEISILMPVYNPDPGFLLKAIESIRAQSRRNWRLIAVDDASTREEGKEILRSLAADDKRVKIKFREQNGHISLATNDALALAETPWVALMDQDDALSPHALACVGETIRADTRLVYSDEDHIDHNDVRRAPIFRPDFDYEQFTAGHLTAYFTQTMRDAGGMRVGYEGFQDSDLALRVTEILEPNRIVHVPKILYHWRVHPGSSAAAIASKPYALAASKLAWEDAAKRRGLIANAIPAGKNTWYRLALKIPEKFKFSVILLPGDPLSKRIAPLLDNWRETCGAEIIRLKKDATLAATLKAGALAAKNERLLILAPSLEPENDCRPEQALILLDRKDVAMVGGIVWNDAQLENGGFYPDEKGALFPLLRGASKEVLPFFAWGQFLLQRRVVGVDWRAVAIGKSALLTEDINAEYGDYALVDLSLRLNLRGQKTLVSPWSQWRDNRRAAFVPPPEIFNDNWREYLKKDGVRNPNLILAPDMDWTLAGLN